MILLLLVLIQPRQHVPEYDLIVFREVVYHQHHEHFQGRTTWRKRSIITYDRLWTNRWEQVEQFKVNKFPEVVTKRQNKVFWFTNKESITKDETTTKVRVFRKLQTRMLLYTRQIVHLPARLLSTE